MDKGKLNLLQYFYMAAWFACTLITCALGIRSLFVQYGIDCSTYAEWPQRINKNPIVMLICAIAVIVLVLFVAKKIAQLVDNKPQRLVIAVIIIAIVELILGIAWSNFNHYPPNADQEIVYTTARSLYSGEALDSSHVLYMNMFRHQRGMVMLLVGLFSIFQTTSFMLCFYLNAGFSALCLVGLCVLTFDYTEDAYATLVCALLTLAFVPLMLYSTYVYGTVASLMLVIWSFVGIQRFMKKERPQWLCLPVLLLWLATLSYRATLIAVIAAVMTLVCFAISKHKEPKLLVASLVASALVVATCHISGKVVDAAYLRMSNISVEEDGVPSSAWIAMGLTAEGILGEGGYNVLQEDLYDQCNHDGDATNKAAIAIIREAVRDYLTGKRPLGFFVRKTTHQWADPTFGSISLTVVNGNAEGGALHDFLQGPTFPFVQRAMSVFMPAVYVCAALASAYMACGKRREQLIVLALYFLGGFVFQLLWEQKPRYCLPYFSCILPLAAWGMVMLQRSFSERLESFRTTA